MTPVFLVTPTPLQAPPVQRLAPHADWMGQGLRDISAAIWAVPSSGDSGPASPGYGRLAPPQHSGAKALFPGMTRVYRAPHRLKTRSFVSHHWGAAIPPSPGGEGPRAAFLWSRKPARAGIVANMR